MTMHWEECWRFSTARFDIVLEVTPCEEDPADSFDYEGCETEVQQIRDGLIAWFDARVRVLLEDREVGSDYLGCCSYNSVNEFRTMHIRYGQGDYFGDMVRCAVSDARKRLNGVSLRTAR